MATQIRKVIAISVALAILVLATTATPYAVEGFGGQDLGEGGNPYHKSGAEQIR